MTDGETLPGARQLAETYTGGYYDDPWAIVRQYDEVERYTAEHPNASSTAVANAIGAPRGRVRPWMDGAVPDPVRGVTTARNRGWLPLTGDGETFRALNQLVAAAFAGGSINENWVPSWHVDTEATERHLADLLAALGLRSAVERRNEPGRATEIHPRSDASVLGRLLVAMGAPRGAKAHVEDISLPSYLMAIDPADRDDWVRTYVRLRGTVFGDEQRPGSWVRIREERPGRYLDALASLIRLSLPKREDISVTRSEKNITISRTAVKALFGSDRPWGTPEPA